MKKTILAIGMILPMMSAQAQCKVFDVEMVNKETIVIPGIGDVFIKMDNIGNGTEIAVTINVTVSETGVKVTGEKTSLVAYLSGGNVIIECTETPNGKFQIVSMDGKVVKTGVLDADGKAEIENLPIGSYAVSVENKISEKIVK